MKEIYILGRFDKKGEKNSDSSDLDAYMELGWELMTTGLWAKDNLSSNAHVCTTRDRLFMYEHITHNLVAWEDLELSKFDVVREIYKNKFSLLKKYNENEWDEKIINSLKKNTIRKVDEENFVCVQIRHRDHCNFRGGNPKRWEDLVSLLSKKYNKVFIVGKQNDKQQFPKNVEIVNLDMYASLIKSDGCVASFGPSSGCMILNFIYGRKGLPVYIHFTDNIKTQKQNHILFFGDKTNVAKVNYNLFLDFEQIFNIVEESR